MDEDLAGKHWTGAAIDCARRPVLGLNGGVNRQVVRGAELTGHEETLFVEIPFHPESVWPGHRPAAMDRSQDPRGGRGWPVTASIDGTNFAAFIGHRYGHGYLLLPAEICGDLELDSGYPVELVVVPREHRVN